MRSRPSSAPRACLDLGGRPTPSSRHATNRTLATNPEVERDLAEAGAARDRRVVARLAALHVVRVARRVAGALAVRLEHADRNQDLELADERDVVPLLLRRDARDVAAVGQELVLAGHDRRAVRDEAEEAGHGDAAVLDLGVAQPADGGLLALRPPVEGHRREVQRVEVVVRRAGQRLLERLEVAERLLHDRRRRGRRRADERRGGRERERDDEGLRVFETLAAMRAVVACSDRVDGVRPRRR